MLEIQYKADLESRRAEIFQHPSDLMIRNAVNRLRINNDFTVNNKVWDVFPDFHLPVVDRIAGLLGIGDSMMSEINHQGLFIWLFMKTMTQCI